LNLSRTHAIRQICAHRVDAVLLISPYRPARIANSTGAKEERRGDFCIDPTQLAERRRVMARRQGKSVTGTITAAFDKVITDYPFLVLHAAFILGVMLGQQTAKSRFSLTRWARNTLPESPHALAVSLPSFARRSNSGRRKAGRPRKNGRRHTAAPGSRGKRQQPRTAAAAE
jgi:hypothetical protein